MKDGWRKKRRTRQEVLQSPPRWRDIKNHDNCKKISESKPQFSKLNVPTGPSTAEKRQPPCRAPQMAVTTGGAVDSVQGPAVSRRERFRDTTRGSGRRCVAAVSSARGEATQAKGHPLPWVSSRPLTHRDQGRDPPTSHQGGAPGPHHTQPSAPPPGLGTMKQAAPWRLSEEKEQARARRGGRRREEGQRGGDTGV